MTTKQGRHAPKDWWLRPPPVAEPREIKFREKKKFGGNGVFNPVTERRRKEQKARITLAKVWPD